MKHDSTMTNAPSEKPNLLWRRLLIVSVIVAVAFVLRWNESTPTPPTNEVDHPVVRTLESVEEKIAEEAVEVREAQAAAVVVKNVTLNDQSGRTIYRGDVDLRPTLDRIAAGQLLDQFRNDGSVFQNRERRLPKRPPGYYREYVVPTQGQSGPGPQRLVVGKEGETFYTHDHYKSFRKIR